MKTYADIMQWCDGALERFGDPSRPICQLFYRWDGNVSLPTSDDLEFHAESKELRLPIFKSRKAITLPVGTGQPVIGEDGDLVTFGLEEITEGVWKLTPSLNIPGIIHAFVVLYGVPNPAPWTRSIITL